MNSREKTAILLFHADRTSRFGLGTSESLGWASSDRHDVRLQILLEIGGLDNCSVIDVGCGYGDLREYIDEWFNGVDYVGIDHYAPFLDYAAARFRDRPDTRFLQGDFLSVALPISDYGFASGSLSYRSDNPRFAMHAIDQLYPTCRLGFAFNLLSSVDKLEKVVTAYSPEEILTHCQRHTPNVEIRDDYLDGDFTVYMRRPT
jgi:SAM-dependent methyltransferase